tara:strand:- start:91 stop:315 length:225 start_codon:yes stop_codon:yes gene_type:complete
VGECPVGQAFPHCRKVPVRKGGAKIVAGNKLKEWEGNFYLIVLYGRGKGIKKAQRVSGLKKNESYNSLTKTYTL